MSYISKDWQEHQRKRWMRPDAARWMRPDAVRYLRHDAWRFLPPEEQLQHKYRPDQARVPAGNPDGGQWTAEGGGGEEASTTEFSAARARGHHYVPRAVFERYSLSPDARRVFNDVTTGKLDDPRNNIWDKEHQAYNTAVGEAFERFLTENGISPEAMTADQAFSFLREVLTSHDPRIRDFNRLIGVREMIRRLFRGGGRE